MDGYFNSSIEQQTIYDIYRACRLCGAGAGYKMPIMQNVVHLDSAEVDLKQKIRECVQIEVHQEDKMPPLICELCVDKVNDFYEFLEMCRQTNKRTRLRLGLPPQTMPRGAPDAGDCILGVTEPVYLNEDLNESLLKPRDRTVKGRFRKEPSGKKRKSREKDSRAVCVRQPSPPRLRAGKRTREDDVALSTLQTPPRRRSNTTPKSILRKDQEVKIEEDWSPGRSRRSRDSKDKQTIKRVKIVDVKPPKAAPKPEFRCKTCKAVFNTSRALDNHARSHAEKDKKVNKNVTCNKCKKEFPSKTVMDRHKCTTVIYKCVNCGRYVNNARNLSRHETACLSKKEFRVSPKLMERLKPVQIRVERCDVLLQRRIGDGYDVSSVPANFGLVKNCTYPYLKRRIKCEPGYMVNIHDSIDDFDLNQDYIHWDSDSTNCDLDVTDSRHVGSLANLSLKIIFSHKFLGKVPRKKRRTNKVSESNCDSDRLGIDNIIDSLSNDNKDNDSLFGDDKTPAVSNDDFDSLFGDKKNDTQQDNEKADNDMSNDSSNVDSNDNAQQNKSEVSHRTESNELDSENLRDLVNSNDSMIRNNSSDNDKDKSKESEEKLDAGVENNDLHNKELIKSSDADRKVNDSRNGTQVNDSEDVAGSVDNDIENNDTVDADDNIKVDCHNNDSIDNEENCTNNTDTECVDEKISEDNEIENNDLQNNDRVDKETDYDDKAMTMDDLDDVTAADVDDTSLMEALDEQIGENVNKIKEKHNLNTNSTDSESVELK